jgi:hypothetical protein
MPGRTFASPADFTEQLSTWPARCARRRRHRLIASSSISQRWHRCRRSRSTSAGATGCVSVGTTTSGSTRTITRSIPQPSAASSTAAPTWSLPGAPRRTPRGQPRAALDPPHDGHGPRPRKKRLRVCITSSSTRRSPTPKRVSSETWATTTVSSARARGDLMATSKNATEATKQIVYLASALKALNPVARAPGQWIPRHRASQE